MNNRIIGRKQIPQAFLDAFHEAYNNDDLFLDEAMAVAFSAWPGAELDPYPQGTGKKAIVKWYLDLPLPTEKSDD
jgi:hypothetical protein